MKDLFGTEILPKDICLSVYSDERTVDSKQHPYKEHWTYITLLMIPDTKKTGLLAVLNKYRDNRDVRYHDELHFHKLDKGSEISPATRLAKLWLEEVVNDTDRRLYFRVLGIKRDNLAFQRFGLGDTHYGKYGNIYNRFFRTTFLGAVNSYWPKHKYKTVTIAELYHDKQGRLEAHNFFPWHLPLKVSDKRIDFKTDRFCFVESNHREEQTHQGESHFIQLTDVLAGSISHCLDLPTKSSKGKNEVARVILPMLREILSDSYPKGSVFRCFRKYDVSFYPSRKLTVEQLNNDCARSLSNFFKNRRILLEMTQSCSQPSLPWI